MAAAAGGDFAVEEPNLGVARALVVILILHVAAIIAIVVHSSTNDSELAVKDSPAVKPADKANLVAKTHQAAQPKIGQGEPYEYVQQGDTYERFARRHQVDVQELRRMNNNTPLKYGLALRIPTVVQPEYHEVPAAMASMTHQDPLIQEALPPIVEVPTRNGLPAEYEVMEAAQPIVQNLQQSSLRVPEPFPSTPLTAPEPVPAINVVAVHRTPTPQPIPIAEPEIIVQEVTPKPAPAPKPSMKSYTIRKGDTLWAIANRNGISVDKLMSANRNVDPKKMRPGITVKIPAR
ncbi:MAG: LysM peptidoglycan-binding domain-containing protein [Roseibacillus sp.]